MPAGGGRPRRLTSGSRDVDPQLSPDGTALAYLRILKGGNQTPVIAAADGSDPRPLLPSDTKYQVEAGLFGNALGWSPDGAELAFGFQSLRRGPLGGLAVASRTDGTVRPIVTDCSLTNFSRRWYRSCVRTHPLHTTCTFDKGHPYADTCSDLGITSPAWSPDGRRIVISAIVGDVRQLWMVDADGSAVHRINDGLPPSLTQENPSWSPNGHLLAFDTCDSQHLCSIYTMTPAGSSVRKLPAGTNVAVDPRWQKNGNFIDYLCQFNSVVSICEIHPDGTGRRVILRGSVKHAPLDLSWGPGS
jgi:Tol biopolymer transport system component